MFDFWKISDDAYVFQGKGVKIGPLTREELDQAILDMPLSEVDMAVIDYFYE